MHYFEDFKVGEWIALGSTVIREEEIIAFATQYDPQPYHLSAELARQSPFGGLIASGMQTMAIFTRLLVDGILNKTVSLGSPGGDEPRWLKPVRPGDILTANVLVIECTA